MRRKRTTIILLLACVLFLCMSCDDMEDKPYADGGSIQETGTAEMYVLCEGLFNLNNSSLYRYSFNSSSYVRDYFLAMNNRGLGDTANDMAVYNDRLYIVVNVSSTVEVIDLYTGLSVKQIPVLCENGSSRQPRAIAFQGGKAYVCSFDGTVSRIDLNTLEVDGVIEVGRNADDLCVQNGKLYVSNSGGLDTEGIGVDRTVSVVDLASFTELKKIEVGPNPGKILAGPEDKVYVVTRGEHIETGNYQFVQIDAETDCVTNTFNEKVLNFAINNDVAYLYNYNYQTQETGFKMFSLTEGRVLREEFITDDTRIETPYAIEVNPYSGNVYISEAYSYTLEGDVLCFSPEGKLLSRLKQVGLNPNTIIFRDVSSDNPNPEEPEDPDAPTPYANKVFQYRPAPGQFVNTTTTAYKDGFTTETQVLEYATERLQKHSLLSLGGFGGYIVVGFQQPIPNIEGAYDFKIHGNAYYNPNAWQNRPGGSAEPGIVMVAKDVNGNGIPDDTWYELAGSEYGKDSEIRNYQITYYRPNPADSDVRWTDNQGNEGYVLRNFAHVQESYYPLWIEEDEMTFTGVRLKDNAVKENGMWIEYAYDWGYADNHPNDTDMAKFKIDWAVDAYGQPVLLDEIDFVKIYTAVNLDAGQLGEASTEITTVENLHFEP